MLYTNYYQEGWETHSKESSENDVQDEQVSQT